MLKTRQNIFQIVYIFHKNVVNLYISCKIDTWLRDLNTDFTLVNCLVGAIRLTKNRGPNKYG